MANRKTIYLLFRWVRPHHYILLMAFSTIASFVVGYSISVGKNKVHYLFPYISDTGSKPPASCYFGLLLNFASVFAAITMYFRHNFLENLPLSTHRLHVLNDVTLLLGGISAFGIMLVANFQETAVLSIHLIGAFLTFFLGNIYCFINNYFTYITIPSGLSTKYKFYVRCLLSILSTVGLALTIIGANIAAGQSDSKPGPNPMWNENDKGYSAHLVSTFSEWVMGISFVVYFLTFFGEFKTINASVTLQFIETYNEEQPLRI